MQTLAEQMKEEFLETIGQELEERGRKSAKEEAARQMLKKGFDIDTIIDITGLEKTDIEKLVSKSH